MCGSGGCTDLQLLPLLEGTLTCAGLATSYVWRLDAVLSAATRWQRAPGRRCWESLGSKGEGPAQLWGPPEVRLGDEAPGVVSCRRQQLVPRHSWPQVGASSVFSSRGGNSPWALQCRARRAPVQEQVPLPRAWLGVTFCH